MIENKIKTLNQLIRILPAIRNCGKTIAFTNGCFDILHYGHVNYLERAKKKADILVVGVNTDSSVRNIKGENRPIINQDDRVRMIAALESVDYVVLFSEPTPIKLITRIKPDVLIKGADWKLQDIVGADFVKSYGGAVKTIPFVGKLSTSNIIKKIIEKH